MEDVSRPKRARGERQRLQDAQRRQRKKQERQQLKEKAQQLETQLDQLQQKLPHLAVQTTSPSHKKRKPNRYEYSWKEKAESMKQGRIEAELLNMTLRRALAKEQMVARSLHTITNKRPVMPHSIVYDMHRASHHQIETKTQISQCSHCCNPTTLHMNPTAVRREIEAMLQRLHDQANATLSHSTAMDDSLSFHFDIQRDPSAGPTTFEVTTLTPMNCGMDRAVRLLGTTIHVKGSNDIADRRCVPEPRPSGGDLYVQQFTVELGAPYRTVLLDGFGSTRKSNDTNWRLILWVAISFDRCGALCFRECTWFAVHRSNPLNKCVIRSHCSVAVEKAVGCTVVDGEPVDHVRDRALLAMGKQIKERYLAMQREILVGTGRGDLVDFVGA